MSCTPFQELLSAELDGDLSQAEQGQLRQHLSQCAACQSLRQRLGHLQTGFGHLPEVTPPALRSPVTPLPLPASKAPSSAPVAALWLSLLAAAACLAVLSWPQNSSPGDGQGVALYLAPHTLQTSPPQTSSLAHFEFQSGPLYGRALPDRKLEFAIHLDSHQRACKELHLEIEFDFEGDGKVDRREAYAPFSTDGQEGWEIYTHEHGLPTEQGELRDFTGGTISARLKNVVGEVHLLSGSSKLVIPYRFAG